jgi:hypothetical protein
VFHFNLTLEDAASGTAIAATLRKIATQIETEQITIEEPQGSLVNDDTGRAIGKWYTDMDQKSISQIEPSLINEPELNLELVGGRRS